MFPLIQSLQTLKFRLDTEQYFDFILDPTNKNIKLE